MRCSLTIIKPFQIPNNDSLVIMTATTTDAGTYYCEVTNLCGTIKSDEVMVTISASSVVSSVEDDNAVLVYPNPTSDFINLDFLFFTLYLFK